MVPTQNYRPILYSSQPLNKKLKSLFLTHTHTLSRLIIPACNAVEKDVTVEKFPPSPSQVINVSFTCAARAAFHSTCKLYINTLKRKELCCEKIPHKGEGSGGGKNEKLCSSVGNPALNIGDYNPCVILLAYRKVLTLSFHKKKIF